MGVFFREFPPVRQRGFDIRVRFWDVSFHPAPSEPEHRKSLWREVLQNLDRQVDSVRITPRVSAAAKRSILG